MKNLMTKTRLLGAASLTVLLSATVAQAQVAGMRVNIPFEFMVGAEVHPAGQYFVDMEKKASRTLELRSTERATGIFLPASPATRPDNAIGTGVLVFHKYGDIYFLSSVWARGYTQGLQLPQTKTEREMAKAAASSRVAQAASAVEIPVTE
ncbi:MAG: hypothetical protein M1541_10835 [Acidobacteria bacterium]|nr:hypothetical protein [Acidobacteriota bacterium]